MKKTHLIYLFTSILIYSCGSEATTSTPEKTNQVANSDIKLESLSEEEMVDRIKSLENKLVDETSLETSKAHSIELLETAQKYIEKFPNSKNRRTVLRKGSQAAQGLNKPYEAIRLLDIAINENTSDSTIYEEMNNQAFLYDQMGNKTRAKEIYRKLISDFPNNPYIESQKGMLKIIDMSPEELNKWLEKQHEK